MEHGHDQTRVSIPSPIVEGASQKSKPMLMPNDARSSRCRRAHYQKIAITCVRMCEYVLSVKNAFADAETENHPKAIA